MAEKLKVKKIKKPRRYKIRHFVILSLMLHMIIVQTSGYLLKNEEAQKAPIQVKFIPSEENEKKELQLTQGEIADIPKPEKIEKPVTSSVLSEYDSKAHDNMSAVKKDTYKVSRTVAPQKKSQSRRAAKKKTVQKQKVAKKIENELNKKSEEKIVVAENTIQKDESSEREAAPMVLKGLFKDEDKQKKDDDTNQESIFKGFDPEKFAKLDTGDNENESDMETVTLDSQELKYASYFLSIKKQIELVWSYPEEAATKGLQGELYLQFVLDRSGKLVDISLIHSSGHEILDYTALGAVKIASPYNPFPETIEKKKLRIIAVFKYKPFYSFYKK